MILVINSAGLNKEAYRIENHSRELPLGSSIIVSGLRKQGYDVKLRDFRNLISPFLDEQLEMEDYYKYDKQEIITDRLQQYLSIAFENLPDLGEVELLGVSVFSHINYIYALTLALEIKKQYPHIPIFFGGAFINLKHVKIPPFVDFFIKGDGTGPVSHLASHYIHKTPLDEGHSGLWFYKDGKLISNGINIDQPNMEEIPDFSDLNLERYLLTDKETGEKYLKVPYRTSIGCPRRCTFCTTRLVDTRVQFKNIEKVVNEVKQLNSLYDNVLIRFTDASINNDNITIKKILDIFISEGFHFHWRAFAKMHDMDTELLEKAAKSGCQSLVWGIENASPHLIDYFNKGYDVNVAEKLLIKSSSLGIKNVIYLIFNAPGETTEDLDLNEQFVKKLCDVKNITFEFFEFLLEEGSIIFLNPEKYGIEILGRDSEDDFTIRENILWKEFNKDYDEFLKKQEQHRERKIAMMKLSHLETGLA